MKAGQNNKSFYKQLTKVKTTDIEKYQYFFGKKKYHSVSVFGNKNSKYNYQYNDNW